MDLMKQGGGRRLACLRPITPTGFWLPGAAPPSGDWSEHSDHWHLLACLSNPVYHMQVPSWACTRQGSDIEAT